MAIGGSIVVVAVAVVLYASNQRDRTSNGSVDVHVPELSALAQRGARAFEQSCSQCHGTSAGGTETGPPLVHRLYEPAHHGDVAIRRAVRLGVRAHHWQFGAMPKVQVGDRELDAIIAFVRELQRANGIR